ncbi:hypothetical protein TYRP_011867 [Tyrophagus putrescentiae]|nr:hypothetical protein TYRP_011867 [Tyrophagus putrescentiae]
MAKIITSFAEDATLASLTLLPFGWRPHPPFVVVAKKEDRLKSHRQCHHDFSRSRLSDGTHARSGLKIIITTARASVSILFPASPRTDDDQNGWRSGWMTTRTDDDDDQDDQDGRPGWMATRTDGDDDNDED